MTPLLALTHYLLCGIMPNMKSIRGIISAHKLVASALIVGLISIPTMAVYNQRTLTPAVSESKSVAATVVSKEAVIADEAAPTQTAAPEVVATQPAQVVTPQADVILSTQEYAQKYIDLSGYNAQTCFNSIVTTWPERFTASVREQNVKALRAWSGPCAATRSADAHYADDIRYSLIYRSGANGEWFDSALAIQYRN